MGLGVKGLGFRGFGVWGVGLGDVVRLLTIGDKREYNVAPAGCSEYLLSPLTLQVGFWGKHHSAAPPAAEQGVLDVPIALRKTGLG